MNLGIDKCKLLTVYLSSAPDSKWRMAQSGRFKVGISNFDGIAEGSYLSTHSAPVRATARHSIYKRTSRKRPKLKPITSSP